MIRRITAGVFLLAFLLSVAWVIRVAMKPEVLPVGARMPQLEYRSTGGYKRLEPNGSRSTIVIHFHSNCRYCEYQLQLFNDNSSDFASTQMVFLTIERGFLDDRKVNRWPQLKLAQNVRWGEVDQKRFKAGFGSLSVPSVFIFDAFGCLVSKIRGEAKLERILKELRKSGGPEHQVSGFN